MAAVLFWWHKVDGPVGMHWGIIVGNTFFENDNAYGGDHTFVVRYGAVSTLAKEIKQQIKLPNENWRNNNDFGAMRLGTTNKTEHIQIRKGDQCIHTNETNVAKFITIN